MEKFPNQSTRSWTCHSIYSNLKWYVKPYPNCLVFFPGRFYTLKRNSSQKKVLTGKIFAKFKRSNFLKCKFLIKLCKLNFGFYRNYYLMSTNVMVIFRIWKYRITNTGVFSSRPLGCSLVDSALRSARFEQMNARNSLWTYWSKLNCFLGVTLF